MDSQPLTSTNRTKADELFDLQRRVSIAEYSLTELFETFNNFEWEDFTYDSYDYSLELFGVRDGYIFTKEDLNELVKYGFKQLWTHTEQKYNKQFSGKGVSYYNL